MPRIRPLDPLVVNQIAAGEVIERPASVVKELLENSLDALASRIEIDVVEGGTELIRIVDDGEGIHPDDLPLAVASHATSKIRAADDLFRIHTLGFRGEALASIASVSRLRLRSRQADSSTGYEIEVNAGEIGPVQPCGCPPGTQIEVRQLFLNTPVRRRFLRAAPTEFGHISEQFTRLALANPRLHGVLRHNGRVVYELPPTGALLDRLRLFFGAELADSLIPVEAATGDVRLWGYVAHPAQSKATRKGEYLFLNGRCIQDRSLQHALGEAYRGLLMVGRYPIAFLFLEAPPDSVDVNVHPTKAEVRFRDGQVFFRLILSTLRTKFLGMDLGGTMRVPGALRADATPASIPAPHVSPERQRDLQMEIASWAKSELASWGERGARSEELEAGSEERGTRSEEGRIEHRDSSPWVPEDHPENAETDSDSSLISPRSSLRPDSPPATPQAAAHASGGGRVMQVHDCYLILETPDGVQVIDQHALHERILYEQLRRRVLDGAVESQRLLVPITLELSPPEAVAILESRDVLAQLGYGIEDFGGTTLLLSAHPAMLRRADHPQLVRDLAERILEAGRKPTRRDLLDHLLHTMACKAAIKAGQRLAPEEMDALLAQRSLVEDSHHCPHGRPTSLVLSRDELDRQFGRLG